VDQRTKSVLKYLFKIGLSVLAIYIVSQKIDFTEVWMLLKVSKPLYIVLAVVLFNLSKILSAFRLNRIFRCIDIVLSEIYNLRLYYVGMFYNLFLPGGVGGDGYKVIHLKRKSNRGSKKIIAAVLLDRVGGAAILLFIALILALFIPETYQTSFYLDYLSILAAAMALPVLYFLIKLAFPSFKSAFRPIVGWSAGVQLAQLTCAICILFALGTQSGLLIYLVLFLLSSIAAILPISFGGFGLRELLFIYAADFFPISETTAVALGLMFFTITFISSLIGVFLKLPDSGLQSISD